MNRHAATRIALGVTLAFGLSGCNHPLADALAESRLIDLDVEKVVLSEARNQLRRIGEEPTRVSHLAISNGLLNRALQSFVGTRQQLIAGSNTLNVEITAIRSSMDLGRIDLELEAVLQLEGRALRVPLKVKGRAMPHIAASAGGQDLVLSIQLLDVEPTIELGWFQWKLRGALHDLALAAAKRDLQGWGDLRIPLHAAFNAKTGDGTSQAQVAGGVLEIVSAGFAITGHVAFQAVLPMPDGLHVFGQIVSN